MYPVYERLALQPNEMSQLDQQIIEKDYAAIGVHIDTVTEMAMRKEEIVSILSQREATVEALVEEIVGLYSLMSIEEDEQIETVYDNQPLSLPFVRFFEEERDNLVNRRQQWVNSEIASKRDTLVALWDEALTGKAEREGFSPFHSDEMSDHTMNALQDKIESMETLLSNLRPILKGIYKLRAMEEEKKEWDQKIEEFGSSRLTMKGYSVHSETKFMSKFKLFMERVCEKLPTDVKKYEESYGTLYIDGVEYMKELEEKVATYSKKPTRGTTKTNTKGRTRKATTSSTENARVNR